MKLLVAPCSSLSYWVRSNYSGTQTSTVYHPQVSPDSHSSTNPKGRKKSCEGCAPRTRTRYQVFVAKLADHHTTEAHPLHFSFSRALNSHISQLIYQHPWGLEIHPLLSRVWRLPQTRIPLAWVVLPTLSLAGNRVTFMWLGSSWRRIWTSCFTHTTRCTGTTSTRRKRWWFSMWFRDAKKYRKHI